VHQPRIEMGRIAVDLLLAVLNGAEAVDHVVVQPHLVVRASTGPVPASRAR
jgi:DNA-binding LacI/PurR family transcriptional regulator